jgi:putative N-acetyltransferase (TIGR04045 family)
MIIESYDQYLPVDFVFKIAHTGEEFDAYWRLRREIFCEEQAIFHGTDRDAVDVKAIPIICRSLIAGMPDSVVGVVRIDEREPGIWYGSRLGVQAEFRNIKRLSPGVAIRNRLPIGRGLGALGAGLVYKAVSTARALGRLEFLATVQHQNERFFQRLHWETYGGILFQTDPSMVVLAHFYELIWLFFRHILFDFIPLLINFVHARVL